MCRVIHLNLQTGYVQMLICQVDAYTIAYSTSENSGKLWI